MRISEVSKLTGLSLSNIRFYEKKGLLAPGRETESKYRDYSEEDVRQLKRIILFRKLDLPIEKISSLQSRELSLYDALRTQQEELEAKREMIQGSIELCQRILYEPNVENIDVDYYLNYVGEEEKKGKRFAQIEEAIDGLADFSGATKMGNGYFIGGFFCNVWVGRAFILAWIVTCIVLPISSIARDVQRLGFVPEDKIIFWGVWFLVLTISLVQFLKSRRHP